jgi:hypothetical protein
MASASQVEPKVDVLVPVGNQLFLRLRNPNQQVDARQQHGEDNGSFDLQTLVHALLCLPLFFGDQAGDGAPCDLQLEVVRFNSDHQRIITGINADNRSHNAPGRLNHVPVLQALKQLLQLLLLLLHGHEKQEVEDSENQQDRQEADELIGLVLEEQKG